MATPKKPTKRAPVSRSKSKSIKSSRFSRNQLIAFVLVFAAIGGVLLYRSFAAAPVLATLEGETLAGAAVTLIQDSGASGGQAIRVTANPSIGGGVSLPSNAASITLIARASSCSGGWPWVAINTDGSNSVPSFKIATTSWKAFTFPVTVRAGVRFVTLAITNNGRVSSSCTRHLDIDTITLYGPDSGITTPPTASGTVGVPYTCTGRVNNLKIVGTGHDPAALVMLNSGCTGSLSFNVTVDPTGDDGVKVNAGAHDLNITTSSITCQPSPTVLDPSTGQQVPTNPYHQDGVQVQGGTNVTFHNLTVSCPTNRGQSAFYIDGKDFAGISNVVCDGCNLSHYIYGAMFTGPAPGSGVRNSIIHRGSYTGQYFYGDTVAPVHSGNVYASP